MVNLQSRYILSYILMGSSYGKGYMHSVIMKLVYIYGLCREDYNSWSTDTYQAIEANKAFVQAKGLWPDITWPVTCHT